MTIFELISWTEGLFSRSDIHYGHGTDNPRDEAAYLVLAALDMPFDLADAQLAEKLPANEVSRIRQLALRRVDERIPAAYLVNRAWFDGLPFFVDARVLVPRSPIAELIETGFHPWIDEDRVKNILDIGTGSGCIAVACALSLPGARIDAIDISQDALMVAAENVRHYELEARVSLLQSDLFENLSGKRYDLIIANPPYVDNADMAGLPPEYRHEPSLGLAAGEDGLDVVRRLLPAAASHMNAGGILIVEVGNGRAAVEQAWPELPLTWLEFEHGGEGVFMIEAETLKMVASR